MKMPDHFTIDCEFKQDKHYTQRTIKVMLTGSIAEFYLQTATSSEKIYDRTRIKAESMAKIIDMI